MTNSQMHRLRAAAALFAAGAALLGAGAPAAAQSLLASRGLGYVNPAVDRRAMAPGGVSLGLPGGGLSLVNPAAIAEFPAPVITFAFQPDFYDSTLPGETAEGSTARFPLLHAVFPFRGRWSFSAGYGSYLDQNWAVERADSLALPGRTVGYTDRFASRGGVTRLRVGTAYAITERLSVGVAGDLYSGGVRDTLSRRFARADSLVPGRVDPLPASYVGEWSYRALGGAVGVRWAPTDALNLGASASMGGTLEARPAGDSAGAPAGKDYSLPLTFDVGASGRVTPRTVVALGAQWAGWSAADADLAGAGGARDSWTVSGGVEFAPADRAARAFPVRAGARYSALPFRWGAVQDANAFPDEMALTGGLGARLGNGQAQVDLGAERGWRGGGDAVLDESYWRLNLSLTLLSR